MLTLLFLSAFINSAVSGRRSQFEVSGQQKSGSEKAFLDCPSDPLRFCDFYFEDHKEDLPIISLDGLVDWGESPFIVESKSDTIVQVGSSGNASSLCGDVIDFEDEFYASGQQAQILFRSFNKVF